MKPDVKPIQPLAEQPVTPSPDEAKSAVSRLQLANSAAMEDASSAGTASQPNASQCCCIGEKQQEISSKIGWGGPRANAGGPRPNSGGKRPGAGRKRRTREPPLDFPSRARGLRCYVIETHPQAELLAEHALRDRGFAAWLPQEAVPIPSPPLAKGVAPGKPAYRIVPLLPGYVLTAFDVAVDGWQQIVDFPGVRRLMCGGTDRPIPLPVSALDLLLAAAAPNLVIYPADLHRLTGTAPPRDEDPFVIDGDVRITDGAFAGWTAVVKSMSATDMKVLVEIFGRSSLLQLPRASAEPI